MANSTALIVGKDKDGLHLEGSIEWHNEAVTRVMTDIGTEDKTAPPTYTDDLVTGKFWNKDELTSLRAVAYGDPLGNNITVGVAENALIDGWRYVKEIGDTEEVPAAAAIHKDFELCHAQYWLTQLLIAERIFGSGMLYTGPKTFRQDIMGSEETKDNKLDVFTPEYYEFPTAKFDDMGRPTKVILTPNPDDKAKRPEVEYNDFIHFFSRPRGRSYEGYSALYSAWSYITLIRHSAYNLGWAMQKFGTGALIIFLSGRLTTDTEASLKLMLQKASQQRAGVVDANLVDRIEYIGPTGSFANNIPECIDMFANFVAAGSKMSKSSLMGQAGMGGGEIEDKQYYAAISKVQQAIAPYIKELARRRGHPTDWLIDFKAVYAKDERQQAEIRVLEADALLKEKQAERGDIMVNFGTPPGAPGPEEQQEEFKDPDKKNNPAGVR